MIRVLPLHRACTDAAARGRGDDVQPGGGYRARLLASIDRLEHGGGIERDLLE